MLNSGKIRYYYLYQGPTIKYINSDLLLLDCVALTLQSHLSRLSLKERELNKREHQLGELSLLATSAQSTLSAYVEEEVSKAAQVSIQYSHTIVSRVTIHGCLNITHNFGPHGRLLRI